jgi:hypothetical protein
MNTRATDADTASRLFTDATTTIADTGIGRTVADSGTLLATAANQLCGCLPFRKETLAAISLGGQGPPTDSSF